MARAPRQPGLFAAESLTAPTAAPLRTSRSAAASSRRPARHLWLCLHLPALSLEALAADGTAPRAVRERQGRRTRILVCNPEASRHGIRPGMPVNSALALLPELQLLQRDPRRETRALKRLAGLAMNFTPCVSLAEPATLLLEIRGSLRLFDGVDALCAGLRQEFQACGHRFDLAVAPTARGACWLAHAGCSERITDLPLLAARLGELPIAGLPWPGAWRRSLAEMGIETLSACVRLPRDGLVRRLGPRLLLELDQAYGRQPEALQWHQLPGQFRSRLALTGDGQDLRQLLQALDVLLQRLDRRLRSSQRAVRAVWLHCAHRDLPDTRLRIGLLQATADTRRLRELARLQLQALTLPGAVTRLELQASMDGLQLTRSDDWLTAGKPSAEEALAFLERLRGRLGMQAVHGLAMLAEHRPEYAWQMMPEPGRESVSIPVPPAGDRPLWMRRAPLALAETAGRPVFRGELELSRGPERIETGWWDGRDIRRDYYVALNRHGMRLWIYRDLRTARWYLHGIFG